MKNDIVVLIPIYNPDVDITETFLKELNKSYKNIVFVNDGCDKKFDSFFKKLEKDYPVVKHNVNLGKGRGLKNGINYILNNYPGAKAIVTADCDGQHSVKDITNCGNVAIKYPDSLILGVRNFDQGNVPSKSKIGNKITRRILDIFVGKKITDTQTGLRAMSLDVAKKFIATAGERYEYETNVLIYTKKDNIPIREVEIDTIYINDNGTSHFNPIKDSIRIYKLFARYMIVALIAYIIEVLALIKIDDYPTFFMSVVVYLLGAKIISAFITCLCNKHINIVLVLCSLVINSVIFMLLDNYVLLIKLGVDILLLILGVAFNRINVKKEALN